MWQHVVKSTLRSFGGENERERLLENTLKLHLVPLFSLEFFFHRSEMNYYQRKSLQHHPWSRVLRSN